MDNTAEFGMTFAFPDPSSTFVLGFEAGQIWGLIDDTGEAVIDRGYIAGFPVRQENIELYQRMAAARFYKLETKDAGVEGWIGVRFVYVGEKDAKPSLSIVRS